MWMTNETDEPALRPFRLAHRAGGVMADFFFFFFLESALFTVISLLYVLTTVTKCQIAGDLPSALFDALKPGRSPE